MREPSCRGIRGLVGRGCLVALLALAGLAGVRDAGAQAITRYVRDTGKINFVTTGGSLRNSATNTCTVNATSTTALSGIPAGTTIRNAYLYWGGSGGSADTTVTLNGSAVSAARTFAATYAGVTPNLPFFGAFAEVTAIVNTTRNGNYTFGGLSVVTGSPHCDVSAVVSGWSLIVIYESPTERLRAINLYDGLAPFRGSQVFLNPDGFRVPSSNIDGRIAVFTLEGDPANSDAMNGIDEALRYNGNLLDDGIIAPGSDPAIQQFDGTINTQGIATSYGIDVDQYDISAYLSPGQTSGTTTYSSGADLVLLMAQVVSATSDPSVNLAITKTHSGSFTAGATGTYAITVSNGGSSEREDNTVTVIDVLPAGLTYNSFSGSGWSCGNSGQTVTCTHPPTLNPGASFPLLNLVVNVGGAAVPSVANTVTVSTPSFEFDTSNNSATDTATVVGPNLSGSTKSVVDLNGGEANPGDTLRYTVTLIESAGRAAPNVALTDSVPANVNWGSFVSIPAGASSAFAPAPAGVNGNGQLTVSNISIPASGTVTVVFDVTVANVSPSAQINNTAVITNPNGPGASPSAPTVVVSPSQVPSSGTKQLYLWSNSQRLSRTRPSGTHNTLAMNEGASESFVLNPALQAALTLNPGNFNVNLLLARTGSTFQTSRTVQVTLGNSALGNIATTQLSFTSATQTLYTFVLNTGGVTAPAGSTFTLTVTNTSSGSGTRSVDLTPYNGGNYSRVDLNSATVINVDSVQTWTAAWNGGAQQGTWYPGTTVFVRAAVSDPFGSFDISGATVSIIDAGGTTRVSNQAMTALGSGAGCALTTSATCIFQYSYLVPASPVFGGWTIRVTANEGVEGVTDLGVGSFVVAYPQPSITMLKSSVVLSDPTGGANPKRIPLAVVRYDVTITNSGPGTVDANTLVITDPIPTDAAMYVSTGSGNPVVFVNGATPSGLTFSYAANVTYSSTGASGPWTYTPVPDANGFDPAVRAVRIAPGGSMAAAGSGNPSFAIQFRVRIN